MIKGILLALFVLLLASPAQAAGFCDMGTALASYNAALKRKKLGDEDAAFRQFLKLAEFGVAPAQRHVAQYYLEESREEFALEKAVMWSQLAAWGGDQKGQQLAKSTLEASRHSVSETGMMWAKEWRAEPSDCYAASDAKGNDDAFKVIGRFPVIREDAVDEDVFNRFGLRLQEALLIVDKVAPHFSELVNLIPAFEVVKGQGSDRYVQWNEEAGWVQVSERFLQDTTARQLSYNLVLSVQRYLFSKIQDAKFVDQISTNYGKVNIYGSLYGDVKTKLFLKLLPGAVKRARDLPVVLRDKVSMLDEIYYMPPSRYHASRLTDQKRFGSYDHMRSIAGRRIVNIHQRLAFENEDEILVELVRLGTQAQQHAMIESFSHQVDGKERENAFLKALEGEMDEARSLFTQKSTKKKKLVEDWNAKGPNGVKRLYCEAVEAQVKAAVALELAPNRFGRMVQTKRCEKARQIWRKYRSDG